MAGTEAFRQETFDVLASQVSLRMPEQSVNLMIGKDNNASILTASGSHWG
jgi:hypothetical protein